MVSELNMTELQVKEHKAELEKVTNELKTVKQKYAEERRAQSKRLAVLQESSSKSSNQSKQSSEIKFTGGGFRMSVASVNN